MAEQNQKIKNNPSWRFYRSKLSTIVWDPDSESTLADFSEGHFTTQDPVVAKKLRSLGYPEIALNLENPPDIEVNQPTTIIDGDVPIINSTSERLVEERMKKITKTIGEPKPPVVKEKAIKRRAKK